MTTQDQTAASSQPALSSQGEIERATAADLFLDLVFVFTALQLHEMVAHPGGVRGYTDAALILGVVWWIYDAYVWLTGNIDMTRTIARLGTLAGMGGFLVMALAIPTAFGPTARADGDAGLVFGSAVLVVVVLHGALFTLAPNESSRAIRGLLPYNLASGVLLVAAGFVSADYRWLLWIAAVAILVRGGVCSSLRGWSVSPTHFVERHGLVVIIALGESVLAIGLGAQGRPLDRPLIITSLLSLALSAGLWWLYFDRNQGDAERALLAARGERRIRLAMLLGTTHLVMIAGIVLVAAGVGSVVAHPMTATSLATAANLATGVTIYLVGESALRYCLGLQVNVERLGATVVALATTPIGLVVSGDAQLAALVALVVGTLTLPNLLARSRSVTLRRRRR